MPTGDGARLRPALVLSEERVRMLRVLAQGGVPSVGVLAERAEVPPGLVHGFCEELRGREYAERGMGGWRLTALGAFYASTVDVDR